ncbi:MAG: hypothetical protein K2O40_07030 [Lachnospiraceae bacterium]|nr:hypothetical protein [Lachnospiraceae bacterium]MDE7184214.1 hypothetical protein [Lachnospiraceae bacterium]
MDFMSGKGVVPIVGAYIEREVSECRRVTEKELSAGGIAPEARAAFSRKPYYSSASLNVKNRPVLR